MSQPIPDHLREYCNKKLDKYEHRNCTEYRYNMCPVCGEPMYLHTKLIQEKTPKVILEGVSEYPCHHCEIMFRNHPEVLAYIINIFPFRMLVHGS